MASDHAMELIHSFAHATRADHHYKDADTRATQDKAREALAQYIAELEKERDEWKRRAAQHGCNIEDGDPDCG